MKQTSEHPRERLGIGREVPGPLPNKRQNRPDPFSNKRLAVITPMAEEADGCEQFIDAVLAQCAPFAQSRIFVVIDRVTPSTTRERLDQLAATRDRLTIVWAPENRHLVDAYLRGYQCALEGDFDWILEMDAGFSHDPAEMPRFFSKMQEGYDCVFGSRVVPGGGCTDTPLARRLISRLGSLLANLLLGTALRDMTSGYELFTREALASLTTHTFVSRGHFFQTEVRTYCRHLHCCEVPIHYRAPSSRLGLGGLCSAFGCLLRLFGRRLVGRL